MIIERLQNLDIDNEQFQSVFSPNVRRVADILRKYGFDFRIVGGAVRDFIMGKKPRDIDFATDADPAELIYVFNKEGIPHDDRGIGHGTIKAIFGDDKIDVTSIAYRIEMDNGRPRVVTGRDWEQDAKNRDLTINSLSVDPDGTLYDYTGGLDDIRNGVIRMNPVTHARLQEDPNIILRWFKALSMFTKPRWPDGDWKQIRKHIPLLSKVRNDEKSLKTLAGILSGHNSRKILDIMCKAGADRYLGITCD